MRFVVPLLLLAFAACAPQGSTSTAEPQCDVGSGVVPLVDGSLYAYDIAIDDQFVYVTSTTGVWRVPKAGGAKSLVSSGENASALAVDAQRVYWIGTQTSGGGKPSSSTALFAAPLGGGAATLLANDVWATQLAVDGQSVYGIGAGLWSVALGGGAPLPLDTPPAVGPHAFALADDGVYVASFCCDLAHGNIVRVPKTGGAPTALVTQQPHPLSIAVDATAIYWINAGYGDAGGGLMRSARDGTSVTTLVADGPSDFRGMSGLALDGANVYWTESAKGRLMKMPKAGGPPSVIASGLVAPTRLLARGGNLYWTSQPVVDASAGTGGGPATVMTSCK